MAAKKKPAASAAKVAVDMSDMPEEEGPVTRRAVMVRAKNNGLWVGVDNMGIRAKSSKYEGPYIVEVTRHPDGRTDFKPIKHADPESKNVEDKPKIPPIVLPGEENPDLSMNHLAPSAPAVDATAEDVEDVLGELRGADSG